MVAIRTPLSPSATRIMLLGSGELGKGGPGRAGRQKGGFTVFEPRRLRERRRLG
jgi:hypothetical protein